MMPMEEFYRRYHQWNILLDKIALQKGITNVNSTITSHTYNEDSSTTVSITKGTGEVLGYEIDHYSIGSDDVSLDQVFNNKTYSMMLTAIIIKILSLQMQLISIQNFISIRMKIQMTS